MKMVSKLNDLYFPEIKKTLLVAFMLFNFISADSFKNCFSTIQLLPGITAYLKKWYNIQ